MFSLNNNSFWCLIFLLLSVLSKDISANGINLIPQNDEENPIPRNHEKDPVLIVSGDHLQERLWIQISISVFLVLACADFIFETCLFLYVFFQLCLNIKTISEILFAILGLFVFLLLRSTFLLFFILPIPWSWAPNLPKVLIDVGIYINASFFVFFYTLSALTCVYYILFVGITGNKMKGSIIDEKTKVEPMVVILMPIYNEEPEALFRAVESAIRCNYRSERLHVFLAFDEASETSLYFAILKKLRVLSKEVSDEIKIKLQMISDDHEKARLEIFPPRLEWVIEGVRVTICRFEHSGKSPTQGKAFKIIDEMYGQDEDFDAVANTLVLFIDSDIILHENAVHNFVVKAVANPKIKGMTGLITCRTSRHFNVYQYLQDAEYLDGQMINRTAEAVLGAVTCLPGALTLIRLNALQNVAAKYFIEIDKRRTVDFHRYHLGEDRYMTYLLTEEAKGAWCVTFESNSSAKTDAPDTFAKLLKQRRRWFLGGFVNDISTMISPTMWMKVPFVALMKIHFYSSRGIAWILPIMVISMSINESPGLALYFILITYIIRYTLLCINSMIMTRNKVCFSYILLFLASPIFNWIVNFYTVWTWNIRTWGGPRAEQEEVQVSKMDLIEEVMSQKEERIGQTRKSLGQIKTASRMIDSRLQQIDGFSSIRSTKSTSSNNNNNKPGETPLKKFVPFPYESVFMGGGDYQLTDSSVIPSFSLSPSLSPTASIRSLRVRPTSSLSSSMMLSPNDTSSTLHQSNSMPDLKTLTSSSTPYLFAKLSPETQKRASSFKLDTKYLATIEGLIPENSKQRDSSFNLRLSGRSTPINGMGSREPSVFSFDISGPSSSNSRKSSLSGNSEIVDIIIEVPKLSTAIDSN